jgi:hypothetical protein
MRVEIIEGLFLGKVFPVLEIGQGEKAGQYFLDVGTLDNGERRGSWFDAERCRFVSEAGYKQMTVDDAINEQPRKISLKVGDVVVANISVDGLIVGKSVIKKITVLGDAKKTVKYWLEPEAQLVKDVLAKTELFFHGQVPAQESDIKLWVDDAVEQSSSDKKISRNEALDALVTLGKITNSERLKYIHEKELLDVPRCNFITDMLTDFMNIGEPKVKRARGQRGKGKKEAAVSISLRIPADVLKMIDTKAAFNGMDRTAIILSILSKGY